jgi:hypothetical protein
VADDDAALPTQLLEQFLAGAGQRRRARALRADDPGPRRPGRAGKRETLRLRGGGCGIGLADTHLSAEDVRIQLYDDMAVVAFRLLGTQRDGQQNEGAQVTQYLNTGTFRKRAGEWRAVAWQATRIPEPD